MPYQASLNSQELYNSLPPTLGALLSIQLIVPVNWGHRVTELFHEKSALP